MSPKCGTKGKQKTSGSAFLMNETKSCFEETVNESELTNGAFPGKGSVSRIDIKHTRTLGVIFLARFDHDNRAKPN
jgi:hypothetical protein